MPFSKIALMCLETSPFLINDLFLKSKVKYKRQRRRRKQNPGIFSAVYRRLREEPDEFFMLVNVNLEIFDYILEHVRQELKYVGTSSKKPEEKLVMTLRYLTGVPMKTVASAFYTSYKSAFNIVFSTLDVIWKQLSPHHLRDPTHAELNNLAKEYNEIWKFPNCVGAIGGKYLRIQNASLGINQKVIMNAIVDANFRFLGVNVIRRSRSEDSFNFRNVCKISGMQCLPGTEIMLPLVIIGNESYPLKTNLMKPYTTKASAECTRKEMFNDRLKQARVPVDCAFEILTEKWKLLNRPLTVNLTETRLVVKVACLLYNIIKDKDDRDFHFSEFGQVDKGILYLNLLTNKSRRNNRASSIAVSIRDQLKEYIWIFG